MCGIFFYSKSNINGSDKKRIMKKFMKIQHRGPNASQLLYYNSNVAIGFHRLAIVDPTDEGMQPFTDGNLICMVNGEIYNYKELMQELRDNNALPELKSHSDCEIVLPLLRYIIKSSQSNLNVNPYYQPDFSHQSDQTSEKNPSPTSEHIKTLISKLDGEFAFIIYNTETDETYFGVDELRVRPLFISMTDGITIASEQKACNRFAVPVKPGMFGYIKNETVKYHSYYTIKPIIDISKENATLMLKKLLVDNVKLKLNPEREFGFLLSGGLDSSLICGIAAQLLKPQRIKTFTVGFDKDASDVIAARMVAKHINSIHSEFIFTYEDGIKILKEVIYYNESYDQTTTRASIPMSLAVRAIKKQHPEMAVIYSGEMSDELFMGYLEWQNSPNEDESRNHVIKRTSDITYFDGLRADRTVCSVGCELRLPFFSKKILEFVYSLPPQYLMPQHNNSIEKFMLRKAFEKDNLIPNEILWRTKHAFSDATSIVGKTSWKEYLKNYADREVTDSRFKCRDVLYQHNIPQTKEDMLYREIFEEFEYNSTTIPYKWLPNWAPTDLTDASATELATFKQSKLSE